MISTVLFKGFLVCALISLAVVMGRLLEDVYERLPAGSEEKGYVAWGIISEAVLIILIALKLIKG
jgi:hypothetical protein